MKNKHELSQTFLREYEYFLYASEEYLNQHGRPTRMSDLTGHRLLVYDTSEAQYLNDLDLSCTVIETNSYRTLVELGIRHQGIFPLTEDLAMEYGAAGENLIRLFDEPCDIEKDYFMYARHSPKLMMIQKFKTITEQVMCSGG